MKKYRHGLLSFFLMSMFIPAALCQNQQGVILEFQLVVDGEELVLGSDYQIADHSAAIDLLRFYISEVSLYHQDELVWLEKESYHLIDVSNPSSLILSLPYSGESVFDQLSMQLGIDSATHDLGAMSGDLDPTKGMYWSWQSGYINFKMEGSSDVSTRRNHEFQYHLGGYQSPNQTAKEISIQVESSEKIIVTLDLAQFFESIDLESQPMIMSPGPQAAELSEIVADLFE